jgi:glycosyltransferase involved in cell wall biosynthesis
MMMARNPEPGSTDDSEDLSERGVPTFDGLGQKPRNSLGFRPDIAALIPCHNEASSIGAVVGELRAALPSARIFVYDNNSTDDTAAEAAKAGALVRHETRQGKGFVVRRFFADVEADIYLMIDGDGTYDASSAGKLVSLLQAEGLDMVNGARLEPEDHSAYRPAHKLGNRLLSTSVSILFGTGIRDMLSGYRVFSRRFVKTFPAASTGFEIETELTVHALALELPMAEVETAFYNRTPGSASKLRTFHDGFRIARTILKLLRRERPTFLFGLAALFLFAVATVLAIPVARTYLETGLVPRFPSLIASIGLTIISLLSLTCGLILDSVTAGRREAKRLAYLTLGRPPHGPDTG